MSTKGSFIFLHLDRVKIKIITRGDTDKTLIAGLISVERIAAALQWTSKAWVGCRKMTLALIR